MHGSARGRLELAAAAIVFGVLAALTVDRVLPLKKQRAGLLVAAGQWRT